MSERRLPETACLDPSLLAGFLGKSLTPWERAQVEFHLARCAECLATVAALAVDDAEIVDEPLGRSRLQIQRRARRWLPALAAAALLLAACVAWMLTTRTPPAPATLRARVNAIAASMRAEAPELVGDLTPLSNEELAAAPTPVERGGLVVHLPRGLELDVRPGFLGAAAPRLEAYEVALYANDGALIWTRHSATRGLAYPEPEPALVRGGSYLVEVAGNRLGRVVGRSAFRIASGEERRAYDAAITHLDAAGSTSLGALLKAHLAIRRGIWREALHHAQVAADLAPDAAVATDTLRYVRSAIGMDPEEETK